MSIQSYDPVIGSLVFKLAEMGGVHLAEGMLVLDRAGRPFSILQVIDDITVLLAPGLGADFSKVLLKGPRPKFITELESLSFRETYAVGCHASGEAIHLTYLHSILTFVLLRYKQVLLEARGFERSTLSSAEFSRNPAFESEVVYSRFINITGYIRNYWPKASAERLEVVAGGKVQFGTRGTFGPGVDGGQEDPLWWADRDALSPTK
jgi:hypothetical protein